MQDSQIASVPISQGDTPCKHFARLFSIESTGQIDTHVRNKPMHCTWKYTWPNIKLPSSPTKVTTSLIWHARAFICTALPVRMLWPSTSGNAEQTASLRHRGASLGFRSPVFTNSPCISHNADKVQPSTKPLSNEVAACRASA